MKIFGLTTLTDADLAREIDAAHAAVTAPSRLERLEQERARRDDAARAAASELDSLRDSLMAERDGYRRGFLAILDRLDMTPLIEQGPLVAEGYTLARQWYSLADALTVAGERRPPRWDGSDLLELHAPRGWAAFWARCGGRPPTVPTPWRDNLARLQELVGPRVTAIANGG